MKSPVLPSLSRFRNVLVFLGIFSLATLLSQRTSQGEIIFLSPGNLTDALRAVTPVGIAALAMTLVIISGGIDLSVGSIVALAGVISARLLVHWEGAPNPPTQIAAAIGVTLASCLTVGLLNGILTSCLSIQPFVITLASMIGIRGLALWLSNNERIGLGVGQDAAGQFGAVLASKSTMILVFAGLLLVFLAILNRTVFGRYLRALGDNASAARHAGLPVRMIQIAVYGLSGLMAGVAGLLIAARTTTGDPNAGIAMELDTIAVVVIGGASLAGGRGGILGTLNGTLIVGMVANILGLRNVDFNLQLVLKACIIVVAVALQPIKRRD